MNLESLLGKTPESRKKWLESKKKELLVLINHDTNSLRGYCTFQYIAGFLEKLATEELREGAANVPEMITLEEIDDYLNQLSQEGFIERGKFGEVKSISKNIRIDKN